MNQEERKDGTNVNAEELENMSGGEFVTQIIKTDHPDSENPLLMVCSV